MLLKGSCHCKAVRFEVESHHPYPYNLCYCSICRKTAGGGGYAINLSGEFQTLSIEGKDGVRIYRAKIKNAKGIPQVSSGERSFCGDCGSALWVWDPRWPELVHPFASAIDTELPVPPEKTYLMLDFKASWVEHHAGTQDKQFALYPDESIAQWHQRLGLIGKEH
ncbi:MAG: alanine acetyltransferase [SAR324 cluster bacterium]|uniref:Alanine acetyltransferase n=1 Tax=SAR324 cluster bacterium TaxID=2024889 RepID=A0A2A4SKW4_9DELT|nr:MAG: alanine acetyltransferase [SAR324 cluster bacterium]